MSKLLGNVIIRKEILETAPVIAPSLCSMCMEGDGPVCASCAPILVDIEAQLEELI